MKLKELIKVLREFQHVHGGDIDVRHFDGNHSSPCDDLAIEEYYSLPGKRGTVTFLYATKNGPAKPIS